jgi:RNA polymerase sigma-70 factor (ECF subfamily)
MAINRATRRVAPASVEAGVLEGAYESSDEPIDQMINRERAERLWKALGQLKPLDREALDAFYIRGHSLVEIAELLEVPIGTVKRRLHTARKRLKLALESSVVDAREWTDGQDVGLDEDADDFELVGAGSRHETSWL